MEKRKVKQVKK